MKRCSFFFVVIFLTAGVFCSAEHVEEGAVSSTTLPILLKPVVNTTFKVGEKLEFVIRYQFIDSGVATMEVKEGPAVNNRATMQFVSTARSNGFADVFFKVRDLNESTVDAESLSSIRFFQDLHEGHFIIRRTTTIDYTTRVYHYLREYKGHVSSRTAVVSEAASDILSSFFMFRTLPLELGKEYSIPVFSDHQTDVVKVVVGKKIENVSVPAGKFKCVRVQPFIKGDALFQAKEGKMFIWLTHDEKKMPVLIRSKVFIGSFDAELLSAENVN